MRRFTQIAFLLLIAALGVARLAAQAPPAASVLLDQAKADAAANHHVVFAIFHASWCGWCKQLDKFMDTAEDKPIFDRYFTRVYFTVQEREEKKALDTPGGDEVMKEWGGASAGLPFFAFLDAKANLIVNTLNANRPGKDGKGENIGHPSEPYEVDWFMTMLEKAVPAMAPGERATLERYLRNQKK